jgi:hypothetical protein
MEKEDGQVSLVLDMLYLRSYRIYKQMHPVGSWSSNRPEIQVCMQGCPTCYRFWRFRRASLPSTEQPLATSMVSPSFSSLLCEVGAALTFKIVLRKRSH